MLMKKFLFILAIGAGLLITACTKEGPMGPTGPAGKDGTNGTNGTNGIDGVDGQDGVDASITCGECHDMTDDLSAKIMEYSNSRHFTGETVLEGTRNTCSPCHSSQGFKGALASGFFNDVAYTNPAKVGCRTCHKIHETYTSADYDLRTVANVRSRMDSTHVTFSMGNANLCLNCHQARVVSPYPNLTSTDSVKITNSRYGPHYGAMGNILAGVGLSSAVEIPGSMSYANGSHTSIDGACIKCHMANPLGAGSVGGHSFAIVGDVEGTETMNFNGCSPCHTSASAATLVSNTQAEVEGLLTQLQDKLVALGIIDASTHLAIANKKVTQTQLAALLNYKMVSYDASMGVHNPAYTKALLTNSYEAIQNN